MRCFFFIEPDARKEASNCLDPGTGSTAPLVGHDGYIEFCLPKSLTNEIAQAILDAINPCTIRRPA